MRISDISSTSALNATVKIHPPVITGVDYISCTCGDYLLDFQVSRIGDMSKFFGFGIVHKLVVTILDQNNSFTEDKIAEGSLIQVLYNNDEQIYPAFYAKEIVRNEDDNTLTITAYDRLYTDLEKPAPISILKGTPYTMRQQVSIATGYNNIQIIGVPDGVFDTQYTNVPNFTEKENVRDILNRVAEVTQTIYFMWGSATSEGIVFLRLDRDGDPVLTIDKESYWSMHTSTVRKLTGICSATELGDNVESNTATTGEEGVTQYFRDNPYWELREDVGTLLDNAIAAVGGLTIAQFDCDWEGNVLLEIGDKISIVKDDDTTITTYLLNDVLVYDGTINQVTQWEYTQDSTETATNPTTLGAAINQTYARVDKLNKKIELVASEVTENSENLASLTITTNSINATVREHQAKIDAFGELDTGNVVDRLAQVELELDGITATVSENSTKVENITKTVSEYDADIAALQDKDVELATDISTNSSKISTLEVNHNGIAATVQNHTTSIGDITSDIEGLSGEIESTQENVSKLETSIDGVSATVTSQGKSITSLQDTTNGLKSTVEENTKDISALEVSTKGISATLAQTNSKVSTLEGKADTLSEETEALRTSARALQGGIDDLALDIEGVEADLSGYKSANDKVFDTLNKDIADVTKTVTSHTSQISSLEVARDNITLEVNKQAGSITSLENADKTLQSSVEQNSAQIASLNVGLEGITATVSNQQTAISSVESSVEDLEGEVSTVKSSVTTQDKKIATLETSLNGISATVSDQSSTISTLQTSVTNQGTDIDNLESDVDDLETTTSTLTKTTETHTSKIASLETTTTSINATVSNQATKITSLETTTDGLIDKTEEHTEQIGALQVTSREISATVSEVSRATETSIGSLGSDIEQLTKEVNAKVTADDVSITVKNELANGVTRVETTTGFTFNETGLTIEKSGKEMKTQITEDGMTVYRDTTPVLTANNTGVDAKNLSASTYLVIGTHSRFENYSTNRTACFWIG